MQINSENGPSGPLSSSHELFQAMADACEDALCVISPEGAIEYANAAARGLLGGAAAEPGRAWAEAWPQDLRFSVDRAVERARAGQGGKFTARIAAGGRYVETAVSATGWNGRLVARSRDVTEAVETTSFLESVVQALPMALTVRDAGSGRYVLANPAAEVLLDRTAEQLVGRTPAEALPEVTAGQIVGLDEAILGGTGARPNRHEFRHERSDGERILSVIRAVTYDDGGPRRLISLVEDVTQKAADAAALERALDQAQAAGRAKSAFLANIGHEIRTPVNGLVAAADLLAQRSLDGEAVELVGIVQCTAAELQARLEQVLQIVRIEAGQAHAERRAFNLAEALAAPLQRWRAKAEGKGLTLTLRVADDLPEAVEGDGPMLASALGRLADNAIKFTERGGIEITVEPTVADQVRIAVADTGVGFDPAMKAALFDRFRQADEGLTRRFGGLGLGLAIAGELATLMGGRLDGEPRPGGGSRFWLDLPLPAHRPEPEAGPAEASTSAALKILVADDNPTNRRVLELMLGEIGEVTTVADGAAAARAFETRSFDLVLMDMQMPVMGGIEATRAIRTLEAKRGAPRTPLIMLTAHTEPEHVAASLAAGADRHVGKPFTAPRLLASIADLLDP
jgi:PAS domain S-box-containing protein